MNIKITARNIEIPTDIKDYATEKFSRLDRFNQKIQDISILVRGEEREVQSEVIIRLDNRDAIIIEVARETMRASLDLALDKCERQLRKEKERGSISRRQRAQDKNSSHGQ